MIKFKKNPTKYHYTKQGLMNVAGQRLDYLQKYLKLSNEEFARILKISETTLFRYKKAQRTISLETINLLSNLYGINKLWLQGYEEDDC